jgi:hypothetical protein
MQINHNGQIRPAFMGADIGNVSDPSLIRGMMGKLTLQLVGVDCKSNSYQINSDHKERSAITGA